MTSHRVFTALIGLSVICLHLADDVRELIS